MHNVFDEFNLLCRESAKVNDEMKIENNFENLNMDDDLSQRQGEVEKDAKSIEVEDTLRQGEVEEDVKPNGISNSIE
ncbi:hypothetical protein PVL29_013066 [Vitis rotundifolia]|uniref:Uncharacterized protein n=1 Tax=Vitis rotundifolia TaxID=103349 RepID=A0AA38ZKP4_VITRO|nr:hypothetical protein PVL29_013066 [Vitis rotundifolia]